MMIFSSLVKGMIDYGMEIWLYEISSIGESTEKTLEMDTWVEDLYLRFYHAREDMQ